MANLRGWEIIVLIAIVLLLFGSKKLPDAARGIGRSLRIFKAETKGLMDDDKPEQPQPAVEGAAAAPQAAATAPAPDAVIEQPAATPAAPAAPAPPAPSAPSAPAAPTPAAEQAPPATPSAPASSS